MYNREVTLEGTDRKADELCLESTGQIHGGYNIMLLYALLYCNAYI